MGKNQVNAKKFAPNMAIISKFVRKYAFQAIVIKKLVKTIRYNQGRLIISKFKHPFANAIYKLQLYSEIILKLYLEFDN